MPLLDRDTLIDRPVLVNRDDDDSADDEEVDKLGEGGGIEVHGVEFEEDDLDIIAGANTVAVLATGQSSGDVFEQLFANAAIQLKEMKEEGRDIDLLSYFGLNHTIGTVGLTEEQSENVVVSVMHDEMESEEEETSEKTSEETSEDVEDEEQSDIDEVEEEIEDMSDEDE